MVHYTRDGPVYYYNEGILGYEAVTKYIEDNKLGGKVREKTLYDLDEAILEGFVLSIDQMEEMWPLVERNSGMSINKLTRDHARKIAEMAFEKFEP